MRPKREGKTKSKYDLVLLTGLTMASGKSVKTIIRNAKMLQKVTGA